MRRDVVWGATSVAVSLLSSVALLWGVSKYNRLVSSVIKTEAPFQLIILVAFSLRSVARNARSLASEYLHGFPNRTGPKAEAADAVLYISFLEEHSHRVAYA